MWKHCRKTFPELSPPLWCQTISLWPTIDLMCKDGIPKPTFKKFLRLWGLLGKRFRRENKELRKSEESWIENWSINFWFPKVLAPFFNMNSNGFNNNFPKRSLYTVHVFYPSKCLVIIQMCLLYSYFSLSYVWDCGIASMAKEKIMKNHPLW